MNESFLPPFAQSVTESWVALDHFTDRHAAIRSYATYLHTDPPPSSILFFYGVGGNGKTLLARFLHDRCAKHLPPDKWSEASAKPDEAFVRYLVQAEPAHDVPSAYVDFRNGVADVLEIFLSINRQLGQKKVKLPLFSFACVQYWTRTGQPAPDLVKTNFPDAELDFALALASDLEKIIPGTSTAVAFFRVLKKHLGKHFEEYVAKRNLDAEAVAALARWEPALLYQKLPLIFARDLNATMADRGAPPRIVLIFDTYERFWGVPRIVDPGQHPEHDAWFRELLQTLDRSNGIVTIVAGRETPAWSDLGAARPIEVESIAIEEFRDQDARDYLDRVGGHDHRLRSTMIELARVDDDRVHPLLLGMVADIALKAGEQTADSTPVVFTAGSRDIEQKGAELLSRLLEYVDDATRQALRALAACRRFNYDIYCYLGNPPGYDAKARFASLTHFSFVQAGRIAGTEQRGDYSIHDLVRKLIRAQAADDVIEAHRQMEAYYRPRADSGDASASVEAIYHAVHLEFERGMEEWVSAFEQAMRFSRYETCRLLLDVRDDLKIEAPYWQGVSSRITADFAHLLSTYAVAETHYQESIAALSTSSALDSERYRSSLALGRAQHAYGTHLAMLGRHPQALKTYHESIASYEIALTEQPGDVVAYRQRGVVYRSLAVLLNTLSQHEEALSACRQGIASYDEALRLVSEDAGTASNRGIILRALGDIHAARSQYAEAIAAYQQSVSGFDAALVHAGDDSRIHNNKGNGLETWGDLLVSLSRYDEARAIYQQSIASCDDALRLAPEDGRYHANKGSALKAYGDLLALLGTTEEARYAYQKSIDSCRESLHFAPSFVNALINLGGAYRSLGQLHADRGAHEEALDIIRQSLAHYDDVLRFAPDNVYACNNKGIALRLCAEVQIALGRLDDAHKSLTESVRMLDLALDDAPDDGRIHGNRGESFRIFGKLLTLRQKNGEATSAFQSGIAAFDRALQLAPNDPEIATGRGNIQRDNGERAIVNGDDHDAESSVLQSISMFDTALDHAPDDIEALLGKGAALTLYSEIAKSRGDRQTACRMAEMAQASFARVARLASGHPRLCAATARNIALRTEMQCHTSEA